MAPHKQQCRNYLCDRHSKTAIMDCSSKTPDDVEDCPLRKCFHNLKDASMKGPSHKFSEKFEEYYDRWSKIIRRAKKTDSYADMLDKQQSVPNM